MKAASYTKNGRADDLVLCEVPGVTRKSAALKAQGAILCYISCLAALTATLSGVQAQPLLSPTNGVSLGDPASESKPTSIWENGVGEGFQPEAQSITLSAGATYGIAAFGSAEAHDLAQVSFTYGHMLGHIMGRDHWYRGNPEFRLELFTGAQFSPETEWFVGLTPHLRYNFATGTRWIPFADIGAGVTATGIGPPDLSGTFEFNLHAGGGVLWFLKDNLALIVETHYTHWSCAGLHQPNLGLNGVTGTLGVACFF